MFCVLSLSIKITGVMVKKVLFVCMGNICRSPAAEGIFKKLVETEGRKLLIMDFEKLEEMAEL